MDSALYRVSRWRSVLLLLMCAGLGYACWAVAPEFHRPGKLYLVAGMMALCIPFVLWELATATDLQFDARGIRYRRRFLRWKDVRTIRVELSRTTTHRGLVSDFASRDGRIADVAVHETRASIALPQLVVIPSETRREEIVIEANGGNMRIRERCIATPPGGLVEVAQRMIELQRAVLGETGVIHARLGMEVPASAIASPPPPPPRPGFGRKGLA